MYKRLLPLILFTACTAKQSTPNTLDKPKMEVAKVANTEDCPEGVKTGCNVPDVTESELVERESALDLCLSACPENSPEQSNQDCVNTCQEEHFIGQVEIVPDLKMAPE